VYWLDIKVADRINNEEAVYNIAFTVDKKPPKLDILTVNDLEIDHDPAPSNIFGTNFTLSGTASDGNFRGLKIKVDDTETSCDYEAGNSNGIIWGAKTAGVDEDSRPTANYLWSWSPVNFGNSAFEGTHTVTITAYDYAGKTVYKTYVFVQDTTPPRVELNNISDDNKSIEEDNAFIRVSFNDDNSNIGYNQIGLQFYFEYRIYQDVDHKPGLQKFTFPLLPAPGKSVNYNIPLKGASPHDFWLTTEAIPDGVWFLDIEVSDRTGNTNDYTVNGIEFYVNRKAPALAANKSDDDPDPIIFYSKQPGPDVFYLSGTVMDGDFTELNIYVENEKGAVIHTWEAEDWHTYGADFTYDPAACVYTWKWILDKTDFDNLPDGINTITVTASDYKENLTSAKPFSFTKDILPPDVTINNIDSTKVIDTTAWAPLAGHRELIAAQGLSSIGGEKPSIAGSFDDKVSRIGRDTAELLDSDNNMVEQRYFEYRIYTAAQLTTSGFELLDNWVKLPLGKNPLTSAAWVIPLYDFDLLAGVHQSGKISEGLYWLDIKVLDRTGNTGLIKNVAFTVDYGAPKLFIDTAAKTDPINTAFTLEGRVEELNFSGLTIKVDGDDVDLDGDEADYFTGTFNEGTSTYTWAWNLENFFAALEDRLHTITVTASDYAGNSTSKPYTFTSDCTAPTVSLNSVNEHKVSKTQWQTYGIDALVGMSTIEDNSAAIRGSFYDEYSKIGFKLPGDTNPYYFEYRIYNSAKLLAGPSTDEDWDNDLVNTGIPWTKIDFVTEPNKSVNWVIPLNGSAPSGSDYWIGSSGIPDGTWWLDIRVADRTGNVSASMRNVVFTVDRSPPELDVTGTVLPTYGKQTGNVIELSGEARDVNFRELTIKVDDTVIDHTKTDQTVGANQIIHYSWSWVFSKDDFNDEGTAYHNHYRV